MLKNRKYGKRLTRILANPDIKPLAKIVLRNEIERFLKAIRGGNIHAKNLHKLRDNLGKFKEIKWQQKENQ